MIFLLYLIMITATGFVIAYPLWKPQSAPAVAQPEPNNELLSQKEATYAALKELDFDYALGNLTQEDHRELEEKYKDKAVNILKELDERQEGGGASPLERSLESEILRLRRSVRKPDASMQEIEDEILKLRQVRGATLTVVKDVCPQCNSAIQTGAKYCPQCGASLKKLVCGKCSSPYKIEQRFCSECGAALLEEKSI